MGARALAREAAKIRFPHVRLKYLLMGNHYRPEVLKRNEIFK